MAGAGRRLPPRGKRDRIAETAQSALVARILPDSLRGSGFGLLGGVQAFGDFASSAIVGLLWVAVSPTAGFVYAAAWMAASVLTSALLRPPEKAQSP
jgi:hypothetical protein